MLLVLCLAAAVGTVAAGPLAAAAQAKEWRIERMEVLLDVGSDGDLAVAETVTFRFEGTFSYVTRSIPLDGLEGIDRVVVSQAGAVLPVGTEAGSYEVSREGDRLQVRLHFALTDTAAVWTIAYRARGAVRSGAERDELRWHVFDDETPVPIDSVRATVRLPGAVPAGGLSVAADTAGRVPTAVSTGAPAGDASGSSTATVEAEGLPPRTRLWLRAEFPAGVVQYRWTARRVAGFLAPKASLALPVFTVAALALVAGRRRSRRADGRPTGDVVYPTYLTEPPDDLAPAAAGALLDARAGRDELVGSIVDLARRGYLEIGGVSEEDRGRQGAAGVTIRRLVPLGDLEGVDRVVARGLFLRKRKDVLEADEISRRFTRMGREFEDAVYGSLVAAGFYRRSPGDVRRGWRRAAGVAAAVVAAATAALAWWRVTGWGLFALGGGVASLLVFLSAPLMVVATGPGRAAQARWSAFRSYLADLTRFADVERARELFERHMPYAVAFGVAEEWVRRFEDVDVGAPDWYLPWSSAGEGGGASGAGPSLAAVSTGLFAGLAALSDAALAGPGSADSLRGVWASAYSGDGGDGWTGGDFSGGDGGGGGGGFDAG